MVEAVGARHYRSYFSNIGRLLAPGGAFACQAITIHDRHFERARRAVDFIQRHIFPGSCIPSVSALTDAAREASDMRLVHLEDIGEHYVPTLRIWRDALRARRDEAQAIGFDDTFLRLFDFYFAYREGGFAERHISVAHLVYAKEGRHFSPTIAELRSLIATSAVARNLSNFLIFQAVWAACVLGAAAGHPGREPGWARCCSRPISPSSPTGPGRARSDSGWRWERSGPLDSALHSAGLVGFPEVAEARRSALGAPRSALDHRPLDRRGLHAHGLAGLAPREASTRRRPRGHRGPLSFWSGIRLGATEMPAGAGSVTALSIEYAVVFPILLRAAGDTATGRSQAVPTNRMALVGSDTPDRTAHRSDAP